MDQDEIKRRLEELFEKYPRYDEDGYVDGHGQKLTHVHAVSIECMVHGCVIHNPTAVHKEWPTLWRQDDRVLMERVCPHGVGHPDPNHIGYLRRVKGERFASAEAVHGSCGHGCCATCQDTTNPLS